MGKNSKKQFQKIIITPVSILKKSLTKKEYNDLGRICFKFDKKDETLIISPKSKVNLIENSPKNVIPQQEISLTSDDHKVDEKASESTQKMNSETFYASENDYVSKEFFSKSFIVTPVKRNTTSIITFNESGNVIQTSQIINEAEETTDIEIYEDANSNVSQEIKQTNNNESNLNSQIVFEQHESNFDDFVSKSFTITKTLEPNKQSLTDENIEVANNNIQDLQFENSKVANKNRVIDKEVEDREKLSTLLVFNQNQNNDFNDGKWEVVSFDLKNYKKALENNQEINSNEFKQSNETKVEDQSIINQNISSKAKYIKENNNFVNEEENELFDESEDFEETQEIISIKKEDSNNEEIIETRTSKEKVNYFEDLDNEEDIYISEELQKKSEDIITINEKYNEKPLNQVNEYFVKDNARLSNFEKENKITKNKLEDNYESLLDEFLNQVETKDYLKDDSNTYTTEQERKKIQKNILDEIFGDEFMKEIKDQDNRNFEFDVEEKIF